MSNKTIDPMLNSKSGENSSDSNSSQSAGESPKLACTKCGATKVAHSRLQGFDGLKMRFVAKRPYRCLHCYHRFWVSEKIIASRKRVWTLAIVALLIILLMLKLFGVFNTQGNEPRVSVIVSEFNQPASDEDSSPSLASLINMPDQGSSTSDISTNIQEIPSSAPPFTQTPEELLTPEQKARQLLLAKQESEAAAELSQARVEQLEQVLLPVEDELESLVKVEVGYVVERWREAWSNGDIDSYLLNYSADFTPSNDLSLEAWKANRKSRVRPDKNISLELSDFDIAMLEELNSGVVEFNQRYQSGSYVESSRKRLGLVKEQGSWKITSEVELN